MRTAMQELIEAIELITKKYKRGLSTEEILDMCNNQLDKEKEQSLNLIKQTCMFMGASIIDIEISKMEFEDIYNNYYNKNN